MEREDTGFFFPYFAKKKLKMEEPDGKRLEML